MDFLQNLQKAINYIEEHLLEAITYKDIAKYVYMSNYYFHKTFRLITGMTVNEYIRGRRLSMAGQELSLSEAKVIDIALKYGYDSPESFSKAFMRFHGITPSNARRMGTKLKSFNRLSVKIVVEGGSIMDYRIEKKDSFRLLTKVKKFRNEIIYEEGNTEISDYWTQCSKDGTFDILREETLRHNIFCPCAPISEESDYFEYGIGMEYEGENIPAGYTIWEVKPAIWGVFKCIGDSDKCVRETWSKIYSEFLPGSEYCLMDETDIEFYPQVGGRNLPCEIWIPVEKRNKGAIPCK